MAYEKTFNEDLGKKLAKAEDPNQLIDSELAILKKRALELNEARAVMAEGYQKVLDGLAMAFNDIDLKDPNFHDSPNRMARALLELCSGMGVEDKEIFSTSFPAEEYNEMILLKDISFMSMCSHHFFPFSGVAHVAYLPDVKAGNESKVVGLSKLARIVDARAERPQLQERLTMEILNALNRELKPRGAMVVIEAKHGCLNCRGAKKTSATMVTSALSGVFEKNDKLRKEFLALVRKDQ